MNMLMGTKNHTGWAFFNASQMADDRLHLLFYLDQLGKSYGGK